MRFSRVEITNLPSGGLVGIEGPNESGKTTLGELILFALFGRSRATVESPVLGLIRWGAEALSVELEFSVESLPDPRSDGDAAARADYLLFRQVDRHGTNFVKIIELPGRKDVASGNVQVAEFLAGRIGFDVAEFQHSFYHDQYEIRRVQTSQVAFFESATGVKHLEEAVESLRRELEPLEREFSFYQKEIARNLSQIEKYDRNARKLTDLNDRRDSVESRLEEKKRRLSEMKAQLDGLRAEASALQERSATSGGLLDLTADELRQTARDLLEQEKGAVETRKTLCDDESLRTGGREVLESLEKLAALSAAVGGLRARIRDEQRQLLRQKEDPSEGTLARIREQEAEAGREGRLFRRSLGLFLLLSLPLAGFAAWFVLAGTTLLFASADSPALASLPAWLRPYVPWGVAGFGLLLPLIVLLCLIQSVRHRRRARLAQAELEVARARDQRLTREGAGLQGLLDGAGVRELPRFVREAATDGREAIVEAARELKADYGDLLESDDGITGLVENLTSSYRALCSRIAEVSPALEKQVQQSESHRKKLKGDRSRVLNEIRECESQAAKKTALEERNSELEVSAGGIRSRIDLRLLASCLLDETASRLRGKVGPTLTGFVKSILPRLTAGRYRDVRVENDLEIKVFSSEKNDFLSLHELSGGTNEALCLALRLAVSQTLVTSRSRQTQFVFLDEPFKMMDAQRTTDTLRVLQSLSPDLRQFFLVQPEFNEEERRALDLVIRTSRGADALMVGS
jgi:DNA repair exonuclease SbcCD ATPase subunit